MNAVQRSLWSFRSPFTWAAVGLLLLNDHVLKAAAPSWLTGKLSDFAGLFFFPFLVALALGLALDRFNVRPRTTGRLAFALTALWFTLIKTVPLANHAAEALWTPLYGRPAVIVLDITDLMALVSLLPSWALWNPVRLPVTRPLNQDRRALLALVIGGLACLATQPPPFARVTRVAVLDDLLYLKMESDWGVTILRSEDLGKSLEGTEEWLEVEDAPPEVTVALDGLAPLPATACAHDTPRTCYRVLGDQRVYETVDGGATWRVAWEIPVGRRLFMERIQKTYPYEQLEDMGPHDIAVLNGSATDYTVFVAMGMDGVLVRHPNGSWARYPVSYAEPLPYDAQSWEHLSWGLFGEVYFWLVITLSYLSALFSVAWGKPSYFIALAILSIAVTGFIWLIMNFVFILGGPGSLEVTVPTLASMILIARFKWRRLQEQIHDSEAVASASAWSTWLQSSLAVFFLGLSPLVLWAEGIVQRYEPALIAAVLVTGLIILVSTRRVLKLMAATRQDAYLLG